MLMILPARYGTLCIRENPGCLFIATNRDAVGNMTDLQEWPGKKAGSCKIQTGQMLHYNIYCGLQVQGVWLQPCVGQLRESQL